MGCVGEPLETEHEAPGLRSIAGPHVEHEGSRETQALSKLKDRALPNVLDCRNTATLLETKKRRTC